MIPWPPTVQRVRADRLAKQERWAEAYELYRQAARHYPDRVLAAACWQDAALMAGHLARHPEQADCSGRSLALLDGVLLNTPLGRRTRIRALLARAEALYRTGDLTGGEEAVRHVFDLMARKDPDFTADCFHRLGQTLMLQGRIGDALNALAHAVETARATGTGPEVAQELISLGTTVGVVGDTATARDCADEAERLLRGSSERGSTRMLASAVSLQAVVLRRQGRDQEAVARAREALRLLSGPTGQQDVAILGQARDRLAVCLAHCGEPEQTREAIELLRDNHDQAVERGDPLVRAASAANLAGVHAVLGELDDALAWAERAVSAARVGRGPQVVAAALLTLGTVLHVRGDQAGAEDRLLESVTLWEEVRATTRTEIEHVELLGEQAQVYRALQRCRVARGDTDGALEAAERVRGLLLEQRLLSRHPDAGPPEPAGTDRRRPSVPTARQLSEEAVRHQDTVTVVYSLLGPARPTVTSGATTVYIWVIAPDGTRRHHEVDLSALRAALPTAVSAQGPRPDPPATPPEARLLRNLSDGAGLAGDGARDSLPLADEHESAATEAELRLLSDTFLRPVEKTIRATGARHLVIVPDGFLHYVPFNALPLRDETPLVERYEVALAPSSRLSPARARDAAPVTVAPGQALVVGNPDPPAQPLLPGLPPPVLPALPAAEREAGAVAGQYGAGALLGRAATREAVLCRLPQARFAHFATHALAGEDVLRIPGALCLAPGTPADPAAVRGGGSDSPYLLADDIEPLDLSGCRLVVLSACRTGWGKVSPEGNVGLARAFLAAGVDCVVMSLWSVPDSATADLMTAFHHRLAAGATTGEALRGAMRETRGRHPGPADWAGFTLLGASGLRLVPAAGAR